ncbi:MAG TPA: DUF4252 domain-containing protein [Thermoanaerobaculia bacterium]
MKTLRWMAAALAIALIAPAGAYAQKIALDVDTKDLAAKAIETVEVTLDGQLLKAATRFLATAEADEKALAGLVGKLDGIYVRSYTFADDGAYDRSLIQQFRSKIGPEWQKIVNVQSVDQENVEIFTHLRGDVIDGLTIIAAEPRELTFVNIVGRIDPAQLGALEGQFGIPRVSRSEGKK